MIFLPTLRRRSAALVLTFAGLSICAVTGIGSAAAQGAPSTASRTGRRTGHVDAVRAGRAFRRRRSAAMRKAATCLGCHAVPGYKADFPIVYRVPMIGGQNAKYIENALKEYQKGERRFPSMMATAKSLSDQDIADRRRVLLIAALRTGR